MTRLGCQVVELPAGMRHYQTTVFAESWEAYDALTRTDGWWVRIAGKNRWKRNKIRGYYIVVFEPLEPRP